MKFNGLLKRAIQKPNSQRFIEIDMLRGLAIILMVFGHILWDLNYFGVLPMNSAIYSFLQKTVPPLFFLLVGISLVVSRKKAEAKATIGEEKYYKHVLARGLKIFGLGMILTVFSFIFIPDKPVFFGVLHCIGLSIIISAPFLKYRNYAILGSIFILFLGQIIAYFPIENPTVIHLAIGLHQTNIWAYTVDYFPLIPWLGLTLLGIVIGDLLYCGNKRSFRFPDLSKYRPAKIFQWAGQHSLGIYLLHQPIIAGALTVFMLL